MQGQGDAMGSLPETLGIDHASSSSSAAMSHQLCWNNNLRGLSETQLPTLILPMPADSSIHSQQNWPGSSSIECSSSSGSRPMIGVPECKMVNGCPSSVGFSGGLVPHLHDRHQSANIGDFALGGIDVNQLQLLHPNYGCSPPSLSLDGGHYSDNAPIVCPGDHVADVNRISRIVQGQFSGGRVGSSDVRHRQVPCKRKSLEGHTGQSSTVPASFLSVGGASLQQQAEPRLQQSPVIQEPGTVSGHHPSSIVQGSAEDSRRNSRLRIISSSATPFSSGVALPNSVMSSSQTSGFTPVYHPVDSHSLSMSSNVGAHRPPVVLDIPASSYSSNSSTSVFSGNTGSSAHNLASSSRNSRNGLRHPVYVSMTGPRPFVQNSATRSVPDADGPFPGNAVYSSGNGSILSMPPISQSSHPNMVPVDPFRRARYLQSRRLSDYVRQALLANSGPVMGGESSQVLHGHGCPTTGLVNLGHRLPSSGSLPSSGRRADSVTGVPNSRHLASLVDERRRQLVELRSAVELMRSGQGLRLEDIMRLHPSVFLGIADLHDQHRNLRLDVDNMSYEELLALEERIGSVSTGLKEETILGCLKQRNFMALAINEAEVEPCCICQEEYAGGEDIGTLDCGHEFHTSCVKKWLMHKNLCPICKTTGLAT